MKRNKTFWWIAIIAVVILALLIAPKFSGEARAFKEKLAAAHAQCLAQGHTNLAQHIHPVLTIMVDGVNQSIPGTIGITSTCMAEVHTHDATGVIHIETLSADKTFVLKDFFAMWGEPFDKPGYQMAMTVDGLPDGNGGGLILKDKQQIVLTYTKTP